MSVSPSQKDPEHENEVARSPSQEQDIQQPEVEMHGNSVAQNEASLYETEVKEQDRWLPIANVARIMKTALPDNAKIAKEAKECMQECVSEFISFITSEASEKCHVEKRKTVNGEDILFAMFSLGFENYSEALKIYLARYRESNMARNENQSGRPTSGSGLSGGSGALAATSHVDQPVSANPQEVDEQPRAFGFPV
ncbi:hypothetical protein FH972_026015 [Carpinus fangiana]|uniref:Transcription factor CBF/NF-Y/archaeal histone domain-containing protein n=1 Tax=Carpinus fangiana TaxID=176857 RepID=A0A5N6L331_9ROSI|nr:hypothetical protein FH972_026015 [Carpinus fangiana]